MSSQSSLIIGEGSSLPRATLGTPGHLAVFTGALALVMLAPVARLPWAAAGCLVVLGLLYPAALRRMARLRFLILVLLLSLPPLFLVGEPNRSLLGVPYSTEGLANSLQIALRILVVLAAIQGLTGAVDIASIAGLLERLGLRGLGFSIGVALNLLPSLQQALLNTWRSLQMRGGFREQRWKGLRLLAITVIAGALSRSEEIALAAEARAFSPERARSLPIQRSHWDLPAAILVAVLVCAVVLG